MAFAGRLSSPATTTTAGAPPHPPGANPNTPTSPATPGRMLWVGINGQSVAKTDAEARSLPPTTPAMFQDEQAGGWKTIGAILPASPAATQPAHRPAYGAPGQPQQPAGGTAIPAGIFAGVEHAQVMRRGSYVEPGDYVARLLSAEFKAGRKGNQIILELAVVTSSYDHARPETHGCNHEGSTMTAFIKQNDSFLGNIKEVILALSGFDDKGMPRDETDNVSQEECNALVSAEQPFKGAMVYLEARAIKTKAGGDFTRVNWWPCPIKADGSPDLEKLAQSR